MIHNKVVANLVSDISSDLFQESGRHHDVRACEPLTVLSVGAVGWVLVKITSYVPRVSTATWWATSDLNGSADVTLAENPAEAFELSAKTVGGLPR